MNSQFLVFVIHREVVMIPPYLPEYQGTGEGSEP
jgi:hypothetical protein